MKNLLTSDKLSDRLSPQNLMFLSLALLKFFALKVLYRSSFQLGIKDNNFFFFIAFWASEGIKIFKIGKHCKFQWKS